MAITAVKYYRDGINQNRAMNPLYGSTKYYPSSTPRHPYQLALPKQDGGVYTQDEAYDILSLPNYGPNHDKPFVETLPHLTPSISSYIIVSNYTPISVQPTDPSVKYILRGISQQRGNNITYRNSSAMPFESFI